MESEASGVSPTPEHWTSVLRAVRFSVVQQQDLLAVHHIYVKIMTVRACSFMDVCMHILTSSQLLAASLP